MHISTAVSQYPYVLHLLQVWNVNLIFGRTCAPTYVARELVPEITFQKGIDDILPFHLQMLFQLP